MISLDYKPGTSEVIYAPTGAGKSEIFLAIIRHAVAHGKRVVVYCCRNLLLQQLIKKFDEQFTKDKRHINEELETLKGQQDVLKISYTVNEKQLLEKIGAMISGEVRNACSDKEREILMNVWIKELKGIIHDFEKLKKVHPREFNLKMNEIADTIELFRQKIVR